MAKSDHTDFANFDANAGGTSPVQWLLQCNAYMSWCTLQQYCLQFTEKYSEVCSHSVTVCCYMQCSVFVLISNAFRECLCTAQCADDRPVEFTRQNHRSRMSMTTTGLTGSQDIAQLCAMHTDSDTRHSLRTSAHYAPANSTAKAVWQQYEILPAWWGVGTKSKLQLDFVTAPLSFLFRMEPCICVCLYL